MSTLADLARGQTELDEAEIDWLHRLVAEWQLIADLSFCDLLLHVRTRDGGWLVVAHMRPTTGPTVYPHDVVGSTADGVLAGRLEGLLRGRPEVAQPAGPRPTATAAATTALGIATAPLADAIRREVSAVRRGPRVVAALTRERSATASQLPSPLELTYLTTAGELLQMVSEGRLPFPGPVPDPEHAPRVGDGLMRLDGTGHVVYASPNALSAYRRLGVTGDLLGAHLGSTIARLSAAPGQLDEPRGSAALAAVLRFGEARESEVEAQGATVLLRALPLQPGGRRRGALVLVRDVTELRSRDRQLLGKDATIREIHHRVKNNLQTVAALLRLQARRVELPQARSALEESVRRVSSIALVHETLSQVWEQEVAFDAIADQVLAMCAEVASPQVRVSVGRTGSFGELPAEAATALALVLTELVQNAAEHAYPGDSGGRVDVRVQRGEGLAIEVVDDGTGLPPGFVLEHSPRLGLQIARTLVEGELRGTLTLGPGDAGRGTRACIDVKLPTAG